MAWRQWVITIVGVLVSLAVVAGLGYALWSGNSELPIPPAPNAPPGSEPRTYWDLADLLIVPLALAVIAFLFNRVQSMETQELARLRREEDQRIAKANREDAALQAYLDRMAELMLSYDLQPASSDDKHTIYNQRRMVASAHTQAILRTLEDPKRKSSVLQFLNASKLLGDDYSQPDEESKP